MRNSPKRLPSLRAWLQSTSVLAVVAGYSILLLVNQRLAEWQRGETFKENAEHAIRILTKETRSSKDLSRWLKQGELPGVRVTPAKAQIKGHEKPVLERNLQGTNSLIGTVPIDLADGNRIYIRIEQDVTQSVQQENLSFWILVLAAGISSLFTSALLRLVLKRGLTQPLQDFSEQLHAIETPNTPNNAITIAQQSCELQPIAEAFNALQARLWASWERQRIFTDGVAHELRTPITLISGHAQSLLRQGLPPALEPSMQLIRNEAERMSSLVSDLLDLARNDAQRLNLQREIIQADDALLQLFERLSIKASHRLQLDAGPEGERQPPPGLGDPDRIQQCLTALVDNALRYSPETGKITLSSSTGLDDCLILHVRDQGPGVAHDERERIFERFVRGTAATTANTRGSGIGLAVVKLLMEAMGGAVKVCDAPEGGADFQLHLQPFRASDLPL